jgi:hypothetical protein
LKNVVFLSAVRFYLLGKLKNIFGGLVSFTLDVSEDLFKVTLFPERFYFAWLFAVVLNLTALSVSLLSASSKRN